MNDLFVQLRRDFPEDEALSSVDAALPLFRMRLELEVLEPLTLIIFEWYVLRAIDLGVATRRAIAHLLGVEERDLLLPGTSLLKLGLIDQRIAPDGGERTFFLTEKGRQTLRENSAPPVPKQKHVRLHFNALTWLPIPYEEEAWTQEEMIADGRLSTLPRRESGRPTLGDVTEEDVAAALSGVAVFRDNRILNVLELKQVKAQYLAPVTVVQLQHWETGAQRLAVYRKNVLQQPESTALQRLFEHQKILVCDRTFAVTGSFNWLSYTGRLDDGYRNETGTLFRHPDQVGQLADIAVQALS